MGKLSVTGKKTEQVVILNLWTKQGTVLYFRHGYTSEQRWIILSQTQIYLFCNHSRVSSQLAAIRLMYTVVNGRLNC